VYGAHIHAAAREYGIDPKLLAALIIQESSGDARARRAEPRFYQKYLEGKPLIGDVPATASRDTERWLRSMSYGLCQVMGQVAREHGYKGDLLDLFDPAKNIDLGARILALHLRAMSRVASSEGAVRAALLRYNGGGDSTYPDKVLSHIATNAYQRVLSIP